MNKQQQIDKLKAQCDILAAGIIDLQCYLVSPKFADDTTVQVSDVLLRLREITLDYLMVD